MAFVNLKKKEVQAKIVYYGPGRGGKTSNLEYIHKTLQSRIQAELVAIKTHGDRTLFFDFLPFDVGKIKNYNVRIQLYTVPGQVKYNATRKLVLRGVDGLVFVADSMALRREKNILSLKNAQENLAVYKKSIFKIPLVLQYNKRDLANQGIPTMSIQQLEKDLNSRLKVPFFEATALSGTNVIATLKKIIALTMTSLSNELK
ncbi:MAG: GTPase domain-containing protein [Deltaproteobacteria bacterium]|nr:GTPase domain-containing protein [Deltaproteobacteria bacterium]MBW2200300.1 GTPase domain-containing protein [Deltaproteobacteria bacterium]MBW2538722.1 GTPase domain-containing protein [Deltaproteobacteria bacterium]